MYWRNILLAFGFAFSLAHSPAGAADNSNKIQTLIHELGDDTYSIRAAADVQLRKMGPAILPALEDANINLDPESELRVENMIQTFWHQIGKGLPSAGFLTKHPRLARDFSASKTALTVNIHEDADGIKLTYTAEQDGNLVERSAAAPTPGELRAIDPKAFEAYWLLRGHTDNQSLEIVGIATSQPHAGKSLSGKAIENPEVVMRAELDSPDLTFAQRQAVEKAIATAAAHRAHDGSPNAL